MNILLAICGIANIVLAFVTLFTWHEMSIPAVAFTAQGALGLALLAHADLG